MAKLSNGGKSLGSPIPYVGYSKSELDKAETSSGLDTGAVSHFAADANALALYVIKHSWRRLRNSNDNRHRWKILP
jgi:hypothetical protein